MKWTAGDAPKKDGWYAIKINYGDEWGEYGSVDILTDGKWCDKVPVVSHCGPFESEEQADDFLYSE